MMRTQWMLALCNVALLMCLAKVIFTKVKHEEAETHVDPPQDHRLTRSDPFVRGLRRSGPSVDVSRYFTREGSRERALTDPRVDIKAYDIMKR